MAGFDWGETLVALFAGQRNADIRCAYFNLHTKDGLTDIKNAVVDTDDTVFAATGPIGTLLPFVEPGFTDDSNYCTGLIDSVSKLQ